MADKIKKILDKLLLTISSILLIVLVLGALWQVFSRYILNSPSTFTGELLGFLLVWVSLLGASYAFGSKEHLALTFLVGKLEGKSKLMTTVVIDAFIIIFAVLVLIKGGLAAVNTTMSQLTPVLGIKMGLVYSILPISGCIILIYKLLDFTQYKVQSEEVGD